MVSTTVSNKNFLKKFQFSSLTNWSARYLLENAFSYNAHFELVPIGDFLVRNKELIEIRDEIEYRRVTIKINNNGVLQRDTEKGENIGTKRQYIVREGQFIRSKVAAKVLGLSRLDFLELLARYNVSVLDGHDVDDLKEDIENA